MDDSVTIRLNKLKITLFFLAAIPLIAGGVEFALTEINPYSPLTRIRFAPELASLILVSSGLLGIILGVLMGALMINKLFSSKPALIIDDEGVVDNASSLSIRRILWKNIEKIEIDLIVRYIAINVDNPNEYIHKWTKPISRMLDGINQIVSGSPIMIDFDVIKCDYRALHKLLQDRLEEYKSEINRRERQ
ncbi:MAG: hypothetical protein LBC09_05670 [Helicobacteraceae bacterium]|nr:hypothetical protein [Helicobacteraceae bacterium]